MKYLKLLFRLILLPFFAPFLLMLSLFYWVLRCLDFLLYGGEIIIVNKFYNGKTIQETYALLEKYLQSPAQKEKEILIELLIYYKNELDKAIKNPCCGNSQPISVSKEDPLAGVQFEQP